MRVYLTLQCDACTRKSQGNVAQADLTNNHQVNIAVRQLGSLCERAENKGDLDLFVDKGFSQYVHQANRLKHDVPNVRIKRVLKISSIVGTVAVHSHFEQSKLRQSAKFLPDSGNGEPRTAFELAYVNPYNTSRRTRWGYSCA